MKAEYGSVKTKILEVCKSPDGVTLPEIAQAIDRTTKVALAVMYPLMKSGELIKTGVIPWQRYFTDADAANRFASIAPTLAAAHRKAKREEENARQRAKAAEERKLKPPKPPNEPKKPAQIDLAKRKSGFIISSPDDASKLHKTAKITWPEHVKVQECPGFKDERFIFKPPSPDWKGEISRDWMNRRMAEVISPRLWTQTNNQKP